MLPAHWQPLQKEALLHALKARATRRLTYYWWLAEWKHALECGRPLTDQAWLAQDFYQPRPIVEAFLDKTKRSPLDLFTRPRFDELHATAKSVVQFVLDTCEPLSDAELQRLVYSTHPHLTLERGAPFDLPEQAVLYRQDLARREAQAAARASKRREQAAEAPLGISLEEGIKLLGQRDMMIEYVPGQEHPWRVRYRTAAFHPAQGPTKYTQHAFGDTWERALRAALGEDAIKQHVARVGA